ncbi:PREDICTED: WAS/WASL-interacting protein family member 1-like [Camelina sativa]|uniref:WAS/WASL-interacting protein family member 1-like n=1 Tax=Camelina sativa TaxID=90675 RepID=A0ABM1R6D7_CAMSA|nr:PREDICTED: WAS/WASL-interacting protein family member 1-like [Camelina sativa]
MKSGGGGRGSGGGGRRSGGGGHGSGGVARRSRDVASSSHSSNPSSHNENSSHSQQSQPSLPSRYTQASFPQYPREASPQPQQPGFQQQLHSQMQEPPPPHAHVPVYQHVAPQNPGYNQPLHNGGYQPPLHHPAYPPPLQDLGFLPPNPQNPVYQPPAPPNQGFQPPPPPNQDGQEHPPPAQNQDFQQQLDELLALPGRHHLPILSPHPIPDTQSIWFGRDKGKLSRVISGILRRKFDGPYFSWKVTPLHIRERYFRSFTRKYNWDVAITELVREGFVKIAKNRMKGIVSQAKTYDEPPIWINPTLWKQMWEHWDTPEAKEKSSNASQARNSDRDGLGIHKHLSGQKSYLRIQ